MILRTLQLTNVVSLQTFEDYKGVSGNEWVITWIPAFAGMTEEKSENGEMNLQQPSTAKFMLIIKKDYEGRCLILASLE